jgi:hypothetical protein
MEVEDLILSELKSLNTKLDDLSIDTKQRLTQLETQVHPIVGNGQPGLCAQRLQLVTSLNDRMDKRVRALEEWRVGLSWWVAGATTIAGVIGAAIGVAVAWTFEWFKIHKG